MVRRAIEDAVVYDLAVIGGGINGVGIARDAVGRGLKVFLCEKGDLASATSSASSKLVHGGLRYLEHCEFRLVRESLQERETLLGIAPHIIRPMRFILPHSKHMRPAWMVRLGLFLYDHLAPLHQLEASKRVVFSSALPYGAPLLDEYEQGFAYTDCWVDDTRLVVLNAMDAHKRGAVIRTRTACRALHYDSGLWKLQLQPEKEGAYFVQARAVVNAAGPWVNDIVSQSGYPAKGRARNIKGSHIIVPRIHSGEHAYILQLPDQRVMFILPYEGKFSLIGTTDIAYEGDATYVGITPQEIDYLCAGANRYLQHSVSAQDVIASYSGVRSLYDDAAENVSAITRDYVLELSKGNAPMLSVFGGKITTYRRLAEDALKKLKPHFPSMSPAWTHDIVLPGGEKSSEEVVTEVGSEFPWLPTSVLVRWARQYGTCISEVMNGATRLSQLGEEIAPEIFEAELRYAKDKEWAHTGEDFLRRRTKRYLHITPAEADAVNAWFASDA